MCARPPTRDSLDPPSFLPPSLFPLLFHSLFHPPSPPLLSPSPSSFSPPLSSLHLPLQLTSSPFSSSLILSRALLTSFSLFHLFCHISFFLFSQLPGLVANVYVHVNYNHTESDELWRFRCALCFANSPLSKTNNMPVSPKQTFKRFYSHLRIKYFTGWTSLSWQAMFLQVKHFTQWRLSEAIHLKDLRYVVIWGFIGKSCMNLKISTNVSTHARLFDVSIKFDFLHGCWIQGSMILWATNKLKRLQFVPTCTVALLSLNWLLPRTTHSLCSLNILLWILFFLL